MTIYLDVTFMGDGIKQLDAKLCLNCMHYFITYEPHFPYGCRALSLRVNAYRVMKCLKHQIAIV